MIVIQPGTLGLQEGEQRPVVAVSARCPWTIGRVLAGTVGGVAAAADAITAAAVFAAELVTPGVKIIIPPPHVTYMEVGAWGDGAALSTAPVLEFSIAHGDPPPLNQPGPFGRLANVLGAMQLTLSGSIVDMTGTAGAARYHIEETTYRESLYDIKGAKIIVAKLVTAGVEANYSLYCRFF